MKFKFSPFVVATTVAMTFFAVFAARAPAMGNSADRAWQLSQLVEGVSTAFNPATAACLVRRPDIVCPNRLGCPRCVSRSPEAHCFRVFARAVRVSRPAVLSALLVIQLSGIVIPPPNFPKEHQKERCGHFRSQRSFIIFHSALRIILLSAGFPVTIHMIASEQTFVNGTFEK